jgi:hypothetical protein
VCDEKVAKKREQTIREVAGPDLPGKSSRRIIHARIALERRCMRQLQLLMLGSLALLMATIITPGQQQAPSSGGWQQTQKPNSGRGSSTVQFTLTGKFLTRPPKDAEIPPSLTVTCRPHSSRRKFSTADVNVGAPLTIKYVEPDEIKAGTSYFPKVFVEYRLNDGKVEKDQWTPGTEKISASIPKKTLERLVQAHTVLIKVEDNRGGEISMQFDIPDSAQLATSCDLPIRKK